LKITCVADFAPRIRADVDLIMSLTELGPNASQGDTTAKSKRVGVRQDFASLATAHVLAALLTHPVLATLLFLRRHIASALSASINSGLIDLKVDFSFCYLLFILERSR
jgi:hypothetical protein